MANGFGSNFIQSRFANDPRQALAQQLLASRGQPRDLASGITSAGNAILGAMLQRGVQKDIKQREDAFQESLGQLGVSPATDLATALANIETTGRRSRALKLARATSCCMVGVTEPWQR